jgi:selenocysteine-specific translation elongation factor
MNILTRMLAGFGTLGLMLMTNGCGERTFKLKVDEVFYITAIDRVIVVGVVSAGTVKAGDRLTIRSGGTNVSVTVERLDHPQRKMQSARAGEQVGLVLQGIRKDQVRAGDFVVRP